MLGKEPPGAGLAGRPVAVEDRLAAVYRRRLVEEVLSLVEVAAAAPAGPCATSDNR